jgi:hypothetical protein
MALYALTASSDTILRASDGVFIPTDPANADYVAYLAWVAAGNTPDPYVAHVSPQAQLAARIEFRAKQLEAQGQYLEAYALRNGLPPPT